MDVVSAAVEAVTVEADGVAGRELDPHGPRHLRRAVRATVRAAHGVLFGQVPAQMAPPHQLYVIVWHQRNLHLHAVGVGEARPHLLLEVLSLVRLIGDEELLVSVPTPLSAAFERVGEQTGGPKQRWHPEAIFDQCQQLRLGDRLQKREKLR
jgi:hypothetical protein